MPKQRTKGGPAPSQRKQIPNKVTRTPRGRFRRR